jgi:hypothetical protein
MQVPRPHPSDMGFSWLAVGQPSGFYSQLGLIPCSVLGDIWLEGCSSNQPVKPHLAYQDG